MWWLLMGIERAGCVKPAENEPRPRAARRLRRSIVRLDPRQRRLQRYRY